MRPDLSVQEELCKLAQEYRDCDAFQSIVSIAEINNAAADGTTALLLATQRGLDKSIIDNLLKAGADVNCTRHDGATPLHLAVIANKLPVVELLLAQPEIDTNKLMAGKTARQLAIQGRRVEIMTLFSKRPHVDRIRVSEVEPSPTLSVTSASPATAASTSLASPGFSGACK